MNLWVEKYRPEVLEQYVGNESIKERKKTSQTHRYCTVPHQMKRIKPLMI